MKNKNQVFLFLAILFTAAGFLAAGDSTPVTVEGVTLQTPVPFSPGSSIGLDAYSCLYPAGAKPGSEEFEITFVFFSAQMQDETGFSEREMHDYARSTFLGLGMPAKENKTRMFAGKEVKGDVAATSIPRAGRLRKLPAFPRRRPQAGPGLQSLGVHGQGPGRDDHRRRRRILRRKEIKEIPSLASRARTCLWIGGILFKKTVFFPSLRQPRTPCTSERSRN